MNPIVDRVTQRIIARSAVTRADYLQRQDEIANRRKSDGRGKIRGILQIDEGLPVLPDRKNFNRTKTWFVYHSAREKTGKVNVK